VFQGLILLFVKIGVTCRSFSEESMQVLRMVPDIHILKMFTKLVNYYRRASIVEVSKLRKPP
jgi:hypothetical protein